jgi:hypothetical protein
MDFEGYVQRGSPDDTSRMVRQKWYPAGSADDRYCYGRGPSSYLPLQAERGEEQSISQAHWRVVASSEGVTRSRTDNAVASFF